MKSKFKKINTVTVVGANGTMGKNASAIFASFGGAKVYMISRDRKSSEKAKEDVYKSVRAESIENNLFPANYSMLEKCVAESDIVFESTSENWDVKSEITKKISEAADKHYENCKDTIFCTGTSGLSVTDLSGFFSPKLRGNYMGVHMFNPPYIMTLCEMISTEYTRRELFEFAMEFCSNVLYRTVVEVKDFPAFLGNRIGFQFINEALQYAEKYKYSGGIDYIDAILGPFTGRNLPPLLTSNFVGLDVHKAIADNLYNNTNDFARSSFVLPDFFEQLIIDGKLGNKSGEGLYKTFIHDSGTRISQVYDIESNTYRNKIHYIFPFAEAMIGKLRDGEYESAFRILKKNYSNEAEICCYFLLKYILYSLKTVESVGYNVHSADDVMAMGFKWCPPLALIQAFGGIDEFKKLCEERIDQSVLNSIDMEQLIKKVDLSEYDFRKFLKAQG